MHFIKHMTLLRAISKIEKSVNRDNACAFIFLHFNKPIKSGALALVQFGELRAERVELIEAAVVNTVVESPL